MLDADWLTGKQIASKLGVKRTTLGRWGRTDRIKARICNDRGEWLYWPPDELPASGANITRPEARTIPLQEVQYGSCSFEIDMEQCPQCGGPLKLIAAIENPAVIAKILAHLGLSARAPPRSPARPFHPQGAQQGRLRLRPAFGRRSYEPLALAFELFQIAWS